jgi:hypothetical protein
MEQKDKKDLEKGPLENQPWWEGLTKLSLHT